MKQLLVFSGIVFLFSSCVKNINFTTIQQSPVLVVDGSIEENQPPQIVLTNSLSYFSAISPALINGAFIHGAKLTLNDGTRTVTLREYTIPDTLGYQFSYYSVDSSTAGSIMIGQEGRTYTLSIDINGIVYTGVTSIPYLTWKIDNLWWVPSVNNPDTTKVIMMAMATDPSGPSHYIRYFTKVNKGQFLPGQNSVSDDEIVKGSTYSIQVSQGIDRNNPPSVKDYGFFSRGDTATLKFCNIDKATYTFWNTWEFAFSSIGNPFSTPGTVIGNISNGALGAFCGYSVQYISLIIPKK